MADTRPLSSRAACPYPCVADNAPGSRRFKDEAAAFQAKSPHLGLVLEIRKPGALDEVRHRAGADVELVAPEVAEILLKRLGRDIDRRTAKVVRGEGGTIGANQLGGHASVGGIDHLSAGALAKRQALGPVLQDF